MIVERISPQRIDGNRRRIEAVIKTRYPDLEERFEVHVVPNAGIRLESRRFQPIVGADEIFSDIDGTLANTDGVSKARLLKYKSYIQSKGIPATDKTVETIFAKTYEFCRYEEIPGGGLIIHGKAQMAALEWATGQLQGTSADTIDAKVTEITNTLHRITGQLTGKDMYDSFDKSDPFHFSKGEGGNHLVMTQVGKPWSEGIEKIFVNTQHEAIYHQEVINALSLLGQRSGEDQVNLGLFTLGADEDQVRKTLDIVGNNPNLPISHIWITQVNKGRFIEAIEREETLLSDGNRGRVRVIFDDNPEDLNAIMDFDERNNGQNGTHYTVVRSLRRGSKYAGDISRRQLREIDCSAGTVTGADIARGLLLARNAVRERFERADSRAEYRQAA